MRHLTQEEQDRAAESSVRTQLHEKEKEEKEDGDEDDEDDGLELYREDGGRASEIGDEITLPLLTDRAPSPRGRQMSASRWTSNDDASDGGLNPFF